MGTIIMMLDTGASKNILTEHCLGNDFPICLTRLSGITDNFWYTVVFVQVITLGKETTFHIVSYDFSHFVNGIQ